MKIDEIEMNKFYAKIKELRRIASDSKVNYEKSKKIRQEQQKMYNKYTFIRKLQRTMEEVKNNGEKKER